MRIRWLAGIVILGAGVLGWTRGRGHLDGEAAGTQSPRHRAAAARDLDIAFYEARAARDPFGARDRAMLAALYLDRARASGSETDLRRAEDLARASRRTRRTRNDGAAAVLSSALMAQHRFAEAYDVMAALLAADASDAITRATLGELALELGRYDEADRLFGPLRLVRASSGVGPRYARWLELSGRSGEARDLLAALRDAQAAAFRTQPEQLAWYDLRLGELAARNGRPDQARRALERGLAAVPDDPRLLAALGRVELNTGHPARALARGARALAQLFDPAALMLLSDAAEASGDSAGAAEYARGVEVAVAQLGNGFHRAWGLFLLDHGQRVAAVRDRALADLATRRDVYGLDLAAWAQYRAGRYGEAARLAADALGRGVQDALLYYHGGRIALAAGDTAAAVARLSQALAINPTFHHAQAGDARLLLDRLASR